ncbi:MAG: pathogenicity island protein [Pseudomonadota bacterium]
MNMMSKDDPVRSDQSLQDLVLNGALAKELKLGDGELDVALAMANAQLKSGNLQKAMGTYAMLVLCRPLSVEYQCGLANCALQMQEYEIALQAASAVIGLAPRDCRGYYFSGAACLGLGHLNEAREDIADALRFAEDTQHHAFQEASQKLSDHLNTSLA